MLAARPRTQELLDTINQTIKGWRYVGREPDETIVWHVLFENGGHWNDLVLGPDRSGSWNVITLHPLRDRQFRILLESGWVEGGCK